MNLQNDNLYSKVEGMLYSYPKVKTEIENIKLDIEELNDIVGIKGGSNNYIKPTSPTNQFNSNVENEVIDRDENLPDKIVNLNRILRSKERFIKKMDNVLGLLKDEERKLIEMKYFKRDTFEHMAEVFGMSKDGVVKRRKSIILELMDIL